MLSKALKGIKLQNIHKSFSVIYNKIKDFLKWEMNFYILPRRNVRLLVKPFDVEDQSSHCLFKVIKWCTGYPVTSFHIVPSYGHFVAKNSQAHRLFLVLLFNALLDYFWQGNFTCIGSKVTLLTVRWKDGIKWLAMKWLWDEVTVKCTLQSDLMLFLDTCNLTLFILFCGLGYLWLHFSKRRVVKALS